MQTVETLNEGLKRAYTLTIPATDISGRIDAEVKQAAPNVRLPGFRPGKVPANLIKKLHGPALEQEALNSAVRDSVQALLAEKGLRPAMQPAVELVEGYEAGKDAELKVSLEVLPDVPAPQIEGLKLERLTVEPEEAQVDEQIARFAASQKRFEPAMEGHPAVEGDLVVMDFVGKVDGVAFEGGTGEGMSVELGSGRLIPGFEAQLEGVKVGEEKLLNVTFPDDYNVESLKGKPATFEVKITEVKVPQEAAIDEDFAKNLGLESLEQLRGLIKGQIEQELNGLTRTYMKRKLLDQLASSHDFPVPPSMVEAEFGQIWSQLEHEASHEADPEAARAEMEKDREDYRKIAERRVRLGLLLSEIGQQNGVEVSAQEMQRLALQAAQQYNPKDRERFLQYIQQDPMAAAQLRAPLYEDKVVDFLFGKAEISDRAVTREELEAAIEAEDDGSPKPHVHGPDCNHDHGHDHAHDHDHGHDHAAPVEAEAAEKPAPKKKAPAKKKVEAAEAAPAEAAEKPAPKKKAPAKKKVEAEGGEG
ncbi:trigger factor [Sphingomonas oleivorans]|uniref:Trigger factor n=1 Tax=Sphingomonas oleivorans TaxID=1735121 RepID=A0A2T5FWF9_9SPHN|nr:trigger factor [Sphingomonas oleivorans]PTQ10109.1 trigger factor [Sphingomonas oleivorans]